MSYSIVGEQILKLRKERGLTQRELGERTGVSSSAVSQWESGGTPDISLLPALSDVLGVTVDALFGRTGTAREDMAQAVEGYIASLPEDRRWGEMLSLVRSAMVSGGIGKNTELVNVDSRDFEETYLSPEGVITVVSTGGRSFLSVIHNGENEEGDLLSCDEKVCRLFAALSEPHALTLLVRLCREPPKYHTAGALALLLGMTREETEAILAEFTRLRLTDELSLETEEGSVKAYQVNLTGTTAPFLAAARLVAEPTAKVRLVSDKRKPGPADNTNEKEE